MSEQARPSLWAPLAQPVFRALWIAGLASDFGAWMHEVGEGWLMTTLTPSPLVVALLQASDSLAVFMLAIPAGALADVVDRRRLAMLTQAWLMVFATLLGALTVTHHMTPRLLIGLTFAMGIGAALDTPLWQAIVADVVPRTALKQAVTLGGLSVNLARAFGPAVGGFIVGAFSPAAVFFVNAATFAVVIVVLAGWRNEQPKRAAPAERWLGALRIGLRYTRHAPQLIAAFVRAGGTLFGGIVLAALLPAFARGPLGLGSREFGLLLGCMGAGAVIAAGVLSALDGKLSADGALSIGTVLFGGAVALVAVAPGLSVAAPAMVVAGFAWMSVISSLNVAVQLATPSWVRARVSAVFMLVFQGALVLGAIVWGAIAARSNVRTALVAGAATTAASVLLRVWFPLRSTTPNFTPAVWPKPLLVCEPDEDAGPVLVTLTYRVPPERFGAFRAIMQELERIRRREGAYDWALYRDAGAADVYVEVYSVDSWAEHLRQHARVTEEESAAQKRAEELAIARTEGDVRHLIAVDS